MEITDLKNILDSTFNIKPVEIGCDDCEERMDEYATFASEEKELDQTLQLIKNHLEVCVSCNEEFQTLLLALKSVQRG